MCEPLFNTKTHTQALTQTRTRAHSHSHARYSSPSFTEVELWLIASTHFGDRDLAAGSLQKLLAYNIMSLTKITKLKLYVILQYSLCYVVSNYSMIIKLSLKMLILEMFGRKFVWAGIACQFTVDLTR